MNVSIPPKHVTEFTQNLYNEIILVCWTFVETFNITSSQSNCWRFFVVVITFPLVSILFKSYFTLNYRYFNWISTYTASVEQWRSLLPVGGERWRCRWLDACCRRVQSWLVPLTSFWHCTLSGDTQLYRQRRRHQSQWRAHLLPRTIVITSNT